MRHRTPDFENLLAVLRRERPARPTLFEFFLNRRLYNALAGRPLDAAGSSADPALSIPAYLRAGYDYATVRASDFRFPTGAAGKARTISLNDGGVIADEASLRAYPWPAPEDFPMDRLDEGARLLPRGMKLIVWGPGGVLENAVSLVGYESLCYLLADDPDTARAVFDGVGSRLLRYYELAAPHPAVGALIANDDWGFNTQTLLSPSDLREYVFPWHKRIVEAIHAQGKPAILHSCGNLSSVMDDVIDGMRYDGKHSYEDGILPVEDAYERWGGRIAILGGIDMDFLCRCAPAQASERARALLTRTASRGGYALGTGNSVPDYLPDENFLALISAATGDDYADVRARLRNE